MQKLDIVKSGVIDCYVGPSSLLLLLFSYKNFCTSNADTTPNSRAMFLHASHVHCLSAFGIVAKHGNIIDDIISNVLSCNSYLLLFDVILVRVASFISMPLSLSLMIMTM